MDRDLKTSADDQPAQTEATFENAGFESAAPPTSKLLHAVALFEGIKGFAALAASVGLLSLAHHDIAFAYAALRFVEGYGLWKDIAWAEWLASASGAIYLPMEVNHLLAHPTVINAAVMVFNLLIVVYMVRRLWQQKHMRVKARSSMGL